MCDGQQHGECCYRGFSTTHFSVQQSIHRYAVPERSQHVKYEESCNFPLVGHLGPRFQNEAMYINGPLQTMFMHRHVHLRSFNADIWIWKGLHTLSMGNSIISGWSAILHWDFEAMYINGPLQTLFMSRHVQLKSFTPVIRLWKGLHMLSMGNPVISLRWAILDQDFKMRLCTSMGNRRHCSCIGII